MTDFFEDPRTVALPSCFPIGSGPIVASRAGDQRLIVRLEPYRLSDGVSDNFVATRVQMKSVDIERHCRQGFSGPERIAVEPAVGGQEGETGELQQNCEDTEGGNRTAKNREEPFRRIHACWFHTVPPFLRAWIAQGRQPLS